MLFNSIHYLFFFPLVVMLFFALPPRLRNPMLLVASYYFYMCWKMEYAVLILGSTALAYFAGLQTASAATQSARRAWMFTSVVGNLAVLGAFKYFNFFNDSLRELFSSLNIAYHVPAFNVLLPVGISFYTFQTLSYSIDVYRGRTPSERNFLTFALYVSFFPQLVAGPIERSHHLLPQFKRDHHFDYQRVADGLKLIAWGFFKKLVIADRVAIFVNEVYNNPGAHEGAAIWLATYFFAFQIYCDFSAYSDIAIGSAQVMGYRLMDNFNRPYFSKSIAEFWKRWHISLSTWFKDYLYIPLGGNRVPAWRWQLNLMIVFVVSGLWHGANWTFVIWGALHGFFLVASVWTAPARGAFLKAVRLDTQRLPGRLVSVLVTFHLVLFAWIFFRANSLPDALTLIRGALNFDVSQLRAIRDIALPRVEILIAFGAIAFMEFIHVLQRHRQMRHFLARFPWFVRWPIYYCLVMAIILFGEFEARQQFIYFQF